MKYVALVFLVACGVASGVTPRSAGYTTELEECNRTATTFEQSVDCENKVRARYGRPSRVVEIKDGGGDAR